MMGRKQMGGHLLALCLLAVLGLWSWQAGHARTQLRVGTFVGSAWGVPNSEGHAVLEKAIESFEAEHPDVDVTYVSGIRYEEYPEWLAEQILAGTEPDVFLVPEYDFEAYAAMGAVRNLSDLTARDQGFDEAGFYAAALAYGRKDGSLYALPVECAPTLMFVNKTLLKREGIEMPGDDWTWQDFYNICAKVTKDGDGDGVLDQFGMYDYDWQLAVTTNGGGLFNASTRTSYFASPHVEQGVQFVMQLRKLQHGHEVTAREADQGKVAFRPFTFAQYRTYKPYPWRIKKFAGSEWDCVRLPAGPNGRNISPVSTLLLGMSSRTTETGLAAHEENHHRPRGAGGGAGKIPGPARAPGSGAEGCQGQMGLGGRRVRGSGGHQPHHGRGRVPAPVPRPAGGHHHGGKCHPGNLCREKAPVHGPA